jgi:hypothetical protein
MPLIEGAEVIRWQISREDDDKLELMEWRCEECDFRALDEDDALRHSDERKHSLAVVPLAFDVIRASIGGDDENGYYLVFRGEPEAIAKALEMAAPIARRIAEGKQSYLDKRKGQ